MWRCNFIWSKVWCTAPVVYLNSCLMVRHSWHSGLFPEGERGGSHLVLVEDDGPSSEGLLLTAPLNGGVASSDTKYLSSGQSVLLFHGKWNWGEGFCKFVALRMIPQSWSLLLCLQQKVVDMFEGQPEFQRIVRLGILGKKNTGNFWRVL